MPMAAIGGALAGAGSLASGASGKKASNAANQLAQSQLKLQQDQFGLARGQLNLGNQAIKPASDYWNALLHGGQAAVQATGPIASQIGQAAAGARQGILSSTPRGGEQNLAIANNYNQSANDVARLYAGMQPLAASQLQGIGQTYMGSGAAFNPSASPGAAASVYGQEMQNAGAAGQGFGSMLYNSLQKARSGGGSSGGGAGGKSGGGGKGGVYQPVGVPEYGS